MAPREMVQAAAVPLSVPFPGRLHSIVVSALPSATFQHTSCHRKVRMKRHSSKTFGWFVAAMFAFLACLCRISSSLSVVPRTTRYTAALGVSRILRSRSPSTTQIFGSSSSDFVNGDAEADKEETEESGDESSCLPPGRLPSVKRIFLISDATGVMSRSILLKSLAQFDTCADENAPYSQRNNSDEDDEDSSTSMGTCDVRTRTFTFIRTPQALSQILQKARDRGACVMYTIAQAELREQAGMECSQLGLQHVDLIGPSLETLSEFLDEEPLGIPALFLGSSKKTAGKKSLSNLSDSYYQRIDAVEFCLKADDGQAPWLLPEADIVLVGVSRSGKTPLSVVLSQTMSLKVANIPLVMEVPPPKQLLEQVDPNRVFCLTISPSELRKIRTNRLEKRGVKEMEERLEEKNIIIPKSNYADRNYILKDLKSVRKLCQEHQWTEIDVTGKAVEETATSIVEIFNQKFLSGDQPISNAHIG